MTGLPGFIQFSFFLPSMARPVPYRVPHGPGAFVCSGPGPPGSEGRWRAGRSLAVVALVPAGLLAIGTFGKLGVDCLHLSPDRHMRRGTRVNQAEVCL